MSAPPEPSHPCCDGHTWTIGRTPYSRLCSVCGLDYEPYPELRAHLQARARAANAKRMRAREQFVYPWYIGLLMAWNHWKPWLNSGRGRVWLSPLGYARLVANRVRGAVRLWMYRRGWTRQPYADSVWQ